MDVFEPQRDDRVMAMSVDAECLHIDLDCGLRLSGPRLMAQPSSEAEQLAAAHSAAARQHWEAAPAFD